VAYFGVPKLPAPYDTFEWAVVSSFFLVHAVNLGKSNVVWVIYCSVKRGQSWQVERCLLAWRKEMNGRWRVSRMREDIDRICARFTEQ
jgi:hypothetical protein